MSVSIAAGQLRVTGDGSAEAAIARDLPIDAVEISDPIGSSPRVLRFADGAACEIADVDGLTRLLEREGIRPGLASRLERRWPLVLAGALLLLALAYIGFRYAAPGMARGVADRLPPEALDSLSDNALAVLDRGVFAPSGLHPGRRGAIEYLFRNLRLPAAVDPARLRLEFRRGASVGPNAFALPSGIIVVTDELVELADDDREILAVLSHEIGHIAHRHSLQQMLYRSSIALMLTWYVGDVSALAASAPAALLYAQNSREFERAADAFAVSVLRANGVGLEFMSTMLQKLERRTTAGASYSRYLSSHPVTAERLRALEAAR
ncbi:MAG TPA: M48 family metallopeptidase [Vicinamibacterales bacterium]|nr:M48 family metallopeptidase [Vicinamibacterales bacterium]